MVDVELRSCFMSSASEPKLKNPHEVQDVIRALNVSRAPGLETTFPVNGIPPRPDL
jgi:hypothetical protein